MFRKGDDHSVVDDGLRRFYAVVRLDSERYQRDTFAKLAAEVIANLAGFLGTDIEISVEIKATNPEGFPDHVTRTVTENARTLKAGLVRLRDGVSAGVRLASRSR